MTPESRKRWHSILLIKKNFFASFHKDCPTGSRVIAVTNQFRKYAKYSPNMVVWVLYFFVSPRGRHSCWFHQDRLMRSKVGLKIPCDKTVSRVNDVRESKPLALDSSHQEELICKISQRLLYGFTSYSSYKPIPEVYEIQSEGGRVGTLSFCLDERKTFMLV